MEASLFRHWIDFACSGRIVARCPVLIALMLTPMSVATPASAAPPPSNFTWSPQPAVREEPVIFSAEQDPRLVAYQWDLDGDTAYDDATAAEVPRTFQQAKTYTVGLRTVDEEGTERETRRSVLVVDPGEPPPGPNGPPDASFVFFPAGPVAGEPVTFVSTTSDSDSPISASGLQWDLNGDGAFDDAEGFAVTTSFPAPGTYNIGLRATTNATDEATLALNVGRPGAPGTNVGESGLSFLSPFPLVRIAGRVSGRGVRIRRLTVDAPPGSQVKLSCSGKRCPFKRLRRTVSTRASVGRGLPPTRLLRMRAVEKRLLPPGIVLRLYVTRGDAVGKYTRFRIRRAKPPTRSDMCLVPGSARPVACPGR